MSKLKVRQCLKIKRIESLHYLTTSWRHLLIMSFKLMGLSDIGNCGKIVPFFITFFIFTVYFCSFHFCTACSGLSHKVSRFRCIGVLCKITQGFPCSCMRSVFRLKVFFWGQFVKHCSVPLLIYGVIEHLYFITCC